MSGNIPVPKTVSIVTVFDTDLLELDDDASDARVILSDYTSVEVYYDQTLVQTFGDEYHDKGHSKAVSFLNGSRYAWDKALGIIVPEPIELNRVDRPGTPRSSLLSCA